MNALIYVLIVAGFIGLIIVLDKRAKKIDAERRNANKPKDPCCNAKNGCGRDECDD